VTATGAEPSDGVAGVSPSLALIRPGDGSKSKSQISERILQQCTVVELCMLNCNTTGWAAPARAIGIAAFAAVPFAAAKLLLPRDLQGQPELRLTTVESHLVLSVCPGWELFAPTTSLSAKRTPSTTCRNLVYCQKESFILSHSHSHSLPCWYRFLCSLHHGKH
jgi:hypothetical protein